MDERKAPGGLASDPATSIASVPEPAPIPGGELVTPRVVEWLKGRSWKGTEDAIALVLARDAFGRAKYGQGLSLGDGRDAVEDLRQELGDALQYAMKARLEGMTDEERREMCRLALTLYMILWCEEV